MKYIIYPLWECCKIELLQKTAYFILYFVKFLSHPTEGMLKKLSFHLKYKSAIFCSKPYFAILPFLSFLSIGFVSCGKLSAENSVASFERAVFAGGCFWCVEADFDKVKGVIKTVSGYTGGEKENPSYEEVSSGQTEHREAVMVTFNPKEVAYKKLVEYFFSHINPTDSGGQFADTGKQYTSAVFYLNDAQKETAVLVKEKLESSGVFSDPIVTEILPFKKFYTAEEYHQNYYKKNPLRYKVYRYGSGRDSFLKKVRQLKPVKKSEVKSCKLTKEELKKKLTPLQYHITQEGGTEPAFDNKYYAEKREGIYVDIVSGEPLFASTDKFKSGSGWPSFTKPIDKENLVEKKDFKLFYPRVEVRSKKADIHLGHIFDDGPKEKGGLRYCVNSAALRFIPKEKMEKEGYGKYLYLFEKK